MELSQIDSMNEAELRAYIGQLEEKNETLNITVDGLRQGLNEVMKDFKVTKDSVMKIIGLIGLLDKSGELKESIDFKQMLGTVTRIMWMSDDKRAEEFGFLSALVPLIIKYKDI